MNTEHDNTLLSILGKITDSLLLCLLYLLSCLPIITIGAATTALYYTTHKVLRCDRSYLWKEYKRAWKENFKQATICWLIFAGIGALLGFDIYVMYGIFRAGSPYGSAYVFFAVLLMAEILWMVYTFAYIARFQTSTKEVLRNSAIMTVIHIPKSLALLAVLGVGAFLVWLIPPLFLLIPVLCAWFAEVILESAFVNYIKEEDREDGKEDFS